MASWLLVAGLMTLASPAPLTLHVAPTGRDTNPGTADRPFASLAGARDAIRKLKAAGALRAPVVVQIAAGDYLVREPIAFGAQDSGTPEAPVTYAAAPGARPRFTCGERLTGFRAGADGRWTATVPGVREGWYFEQLYVNGHRAVRARTPNKGWLYMGEPVEGGVDPLTGQPADLSRRAFRARPGDLKPLLGLTPEQLRDANLIAFHSWESSRLRIAAVDPQTNTLVTTGPAAWEMFGWHASQRYQLENVPAALDEPGEFYLGRDGTLTYLPLPGEDPATADVWAPRAERFLTLTGDPNLGLPVEHLTFRGLAFEHAGYTLPPGGHSDGQAEQSIPGAIELEGARQVRFEDCRFAHFGQHALRFNRGCADDAVVHCELRDLGGGGVYIGSGWGNDNPRPEEMAQRILVDNNLIRSGGRLHHGSHGVWIGHSADNQVTHNDIADFFYSAISVGWRWGYNASVAKRNRVADNHLHHLGWGVLSDMGGIYTLGPSEGTVLTGNVIHDVYDYGYYGAGGWGLYNDEGSTGILMENNLVYRTRTGGYHLHYGKDLTVRNNIFVDSLTRQLQHSRQETHHQYDFVNNLVAWHQGELFGGKWTDPVIHLEKNVYWDYSGKPVKFGELDLDAWLKLGIDHDSLVADPKFVDPEHDDYRLRPDSPALKLGFKPFDTSGAGLYGEPEWVAKAKGEVWPPVELAGPPPPMLPMRLKLDFENLPLGARPPKAQVYTENHGDDVRVTDETAATGKHSLLVLDAPGLKYPYNPHFFWDPMHASGTTTCRFDLKVGPGVVMYTEWRGPGNPYLVGPSVWIRDGKVLVANQPVAEMPVNQWVHFELSAGLGPQSTGTWSLAVTAPGQPPVRLTGLKNGSADWKDLRWLGFSSSATEATRYWLDNLELENTGS